MRDLELTPVLSRDEVVISKKVQRDLERLGAKLGPLAATVEKRWRRKLKSVFAANLDKSKLRALASINPGSWCGLLAEGRLNAALEQVDYHSRRLAKLDVPPNSVVASLKAYEEALTPDLKKLFPKDFRSQLSSLDHLYFCIKLTLNNAYYRVRDMEAQAFYDVFQDQLQSLSVQELMGRVLETLMRTFSAQAGVILLREGRSRKLTVQAWKGVDETLAAQFSTSVGRGLAGRIASSGKPLAVVDVENEPLIRNAAIRKAFHSLWGVPLTVRGEVRGVLQLGFSQEYHCLPREMALFEAVAERCAMAIDKARLLEELHDREEQIRKLGEHMLNVEEEERRRISRELHDEVGQSMQVIRLYLEMMRGSLPKEAHEIAARLTETQNLTEQTIEEMRRLISALSPNVLEDLGLPASIRQFVANFRRTFAGHVSLQMTGLDHLPRGTQIMIYRLVQECFSNIIKHSHAGDVGLRVSRKNGHIQVKVEDDGVGFDLTEASRKRGSFGLSGMRERVALLGGDIEIESALGKGTRVEIAIPAGVMSPEPAKNE
jgi:signal transduction histidine kinase